MIFVPYPIAKQISKNFATFQTRSKSVFERMFHLILGENSEK
jgi:hypothetical protein